MPIRTDTVDSPAARAVVVHAGARDAYQLALALEESGQLEALVTDLFWSPETLAGRLLGRMLPPALLCRRSAPALPAARVRTLPLAGAAGLALDRAWQLPIALRQRLTRSADAALGRAAGRLARRSGAGLVSYSYYGYDAFRSYGTATGRGGVLFQMHPHPCTMRRILREELLRHPDCASSLEQEWELALSRQEFDHLRRETELASAFLAASSFTRQSLVENGADARTIAVVPYGVDLERFHPGPPPSPSAPLKLLFVGRINQRKGLKYLLEALRAFTPQQVHLTICGRVVDDLSLFKPFGEQIAIRPSVGAEELVAAFQAADLFVFPSVGEGFGQVLLESLASGLPVLATTHTAAPDLIEDGHQGFVVEPRRPDLLADRIRWAMTHRQELAAMRSAARTRAETFTWARFRSTAAAAVREFLRLEQTVETAVRQPEVAHV